MELHAEDKSSQGYNRNKCFWELQKNNEWLIATQVKHFYHPEYEADHSQQMFKLVSVLPTQLKKQRTKTNQMNFLIKMKERIW